MLQRSERKARRVSNRRLPWVASMSAAAVERANRMRNPVEAGAGDSRHEEVGDEPAS